MNEKWSIKQIGELNEERQCGYHTITNNERSIGMIDVWFGTHQVYKTSEEALRAAKLIEKAPEMYNILNELLDALDNVNLDFEAEEVLVPLMEEAEKIITDI